MQTFLYLPYRRSKLGSCPGPGNATGLDSHKRKIMKASIKRGSPIFTLICYDPCCKNFQEEVPDFCNPRMERMKNLQSPVCCFYSTLANTNTTSWQTLNGKACNPLDIDSRSPKPDAHYRASMPHSSTVNIHSALQAQLKQAKLAGGVSQE